MSYRQDRNAQWGVWMETVNRMDIKTKEIIADVLVSLLIASFAYQGGADPTFSVGAITFVHSVHIPRALRAYREAKFHVPTDGNGDG